MTRQETLLKIKELVQQFGDYQDHYHAPAYDEAKLRVDFINKFFKAFGWDVDNEKGLAEPYRDVVVEAKQKVGGNTKAPDYLFRLEGGKKMFYVEAKKPLVNIKTDKDAAYQLRRYGRSAQLSISILTNFKEFAIYDCTKRPNNDDSASVARIKYLTYKDYEKEFDFIYDTFSRGEILKGKFDRYVASDTQKRGTSTLDKDFLESLDKWRKYLATGIANANHDLNDEEVNYAVQQILDRLIFLRFCEDRNVEPYGKLKQTLHGDFYKELLENFKEADAKYNSGLFDFKKDKITPNLTIENKVVKNAIIDLYYPDCDFEFKVMPVEILGNAYEQFLGKVIRITAGHIVKIDEKPEVRKAGGVYYTPQYIVEYIVKNTIGKLVEDKTPKEVARLKIVDPACGSGSFLLGALQFLFDYHLDYYLIQKPVVKSRWGKKDSPLTPDGKLTTAEKRRILINNIFGVDIDTQAVEVTKLSLLLKAMEGETEASVANQLTMHHEHVLPNLDENIKCGNSLIAPDFFDGLFEADEALTAKVKPFDWKYAFPLVFKKGGFDVVIGNPPYVRQEMLGEQKPYFEKHYKVYNGTADLYSYFFEKGIGLLNNSGVFGIIVANKWMRANYGEQLRIWLQQQSHYIQQIVDFGDLPVFKGATTYPCIFIYAKTNEQKFISAVNVGSLDFSSLHEYTQEHFIPVNPRQLDTSGWKLGAQQEHDLLRKIQQTGIPLEKYVGGKIYRGVLTGLNEAFVIDKPTRDRIIAEDPKSKDIIKPFLAGRYIKRYQPPKNYQYLIFAKRGINIKEYPAIQKHLEQFKKQLMPKPKDFQGAKWEGRKPGAYKWYELQDAIDYYEEFERPKIIVPAIVQSASYNWDENKFYSNDKTSIIRTDDKYVLGILNSSACDYFIKSIASTKQGGYFEYKPMYFSRAPIPDADSKTKSEIITQVNLLLKLNTEKQNIKLQTRLDQLQTQITHAERRVNKLVYKLYDLSEEEISIIEKSL